MLQHNGVIIVEEAEKSNAKVKLYNAAITKEIKEVEAKQIYEARDLTDAEAQEMSSNMEAFWEDNCAAFKQGIKRQLPGIKNDPVWGDRSLN